MYMLWIPLQMMTFQIHLSLVPHFSSFGGGHFGKTYVLLIWNKKKNLVLRAVKTFYFEQNWLFCILSCAGRYCSCKAGKDISWLWWCSLWEERCDRTKYKSGMWWSFIDDPLSMLLSTKVHILSHTIDDQLSMLLSTKFHILFHTIDDQWVRLLYICIPWSHLFTRIGSHFVI